MALWDALGPAATVAQLVGADAAGLVSATLRAVRTARRNRKECRTLARRVMMVGDLLQLVEQGSSETMQRLEVRRALDGLGDALRRAFELVESCQEGGAAYGFVKAGRQAEQFRDVQGEIDSYLLVFPMVTHIDVTIRLERIYNVFIHPDQYQQASESKAVPGSLTSHFESEVSPRKEGNALGGHLLGSNDTVTSLCGVKQHQMSGHLLYDLLKGATDNFSLENVVGKGSSATVYKVCIGDGIEVAVKIFHNIQRMDGSVNNLKLTQKRFDDTRWCCGLGCEISWSGSEQSESEEDRIGSWIPSEFENEINVLSKLRHTNIIKVLGHCTEPEVILVYEHMPNGSLDTFLFDVSGEASLDWLSPFHIIQGIAHGLLYLHAQEPCIVHRDVKPRNILLDVDMNPKIGDFGLATMISPGKELDIRIVGTFGYMPPEYTRYGDLSAKVDVYAYGVTLLELITSRSIMFNQTLLEDAFHLWETGRSLELLHPSVCKGNNEDGTTQIITRCVQIALLCVHTDPVERPCMSDVLLMLGNKKALPAPLHPDAVRITVLQNNGTCSSTEFTSPR